MLFVICAFDRSDAGGLRQATRPAHLAYLEAAGAKLRAAGPCLDDSGTTAIGSLIILEADSLAEARAFAQNDPYSQANLFERVNICPWRQVFPKT